MFGGITREIVKQITGIGPDIFIAGEESKIRVSVRCRGVVIPGPQVNISANVIAFPTHHQRHFRVNLEAHEAVNNVHTFAFQGSRPLDIAFLIETRLQLHDRGHLFPVLNGFQQGGDDRRVSPHAV